MTCPTCGHSDEKLLLNDTELRQRLGVSEAKFYALKKAGQLRMFEVARPFGQRRYSRTKVEQYANGDSMAVLGGRRR